MQAGTLTTRRSFMAMAGAGLIVSASSRNALSASKQEAKVEEIRPVAAE